jgi:hypothetical protein
MSRRAERRLLLLLLFQQPDQQFTNVFAGFP